MSKCLRNKISETKDDKQIKKLPIAPCTLTACVFLLGGELESSIMICECEAGICKNFITPWTSLSANCEQIMPDNLNVPPIHPNTHTHPQTNHPFNASTLDN